MKITYELNLRTFDAWSGGRETLDRLIELDKVDEIEQYLDDCFADREIDETELNDFLWFETDIIAEWIGMNDLFEDEEV